MFCRDDVCANQALVLRGKIPYDTRQEGENSILICSECLFFRDVIKVGDKVSVVSI